MARKGRSKKDLNIDYAKLGLWVVVGISLYIGYSALETWLVSGEERTHYDVLGVARDASDSDIKRAYRKLALTLHPDKNPDCAECEAEFALVSKAYKVLSDPGKRRDYNAHLVAKARGLQEEENRVESRAEELHDSQYDELFGAPKREDLVDPKAKDADLGEHTGIMWTAPNVWLVQGYLHMSEMVWYFSEEWENLVSMLEGYIRVARVNVDKEERLAKVFYSPRVPTVFLVINGNVRVYSGALTAQAVLRWVTSLFDEMLQPLTTSKQALSFLDGAVERPRALWVTRGGRAIREADMWRRTLASRFHGLVDSAELAARPQEARKREEFESEEEEASYRSQLRWLKRRPYAETSEAKALLAEVGATAADTPLLVISRGAGAPLTLCKRVRKRDDAYGCLYPNRYTVPMPVLTSSSANDLCGDRSCVVYLPEKGVAASTLEIVGKAAMEEKKRVVLAPTRDSAWPAQLRGAVVQWQVGVSSVCPARVQGGDLNSAVARLLDGDCEEDVPLPSKMKLMAPAVQASLDRHPYYSAIILGTILLYIATVLFGCKRINDIGKTKRFFAWRRNAVQAMIDREGIDR